jgi:hypothetical protein
MRYLFLTFFLLAVNPCNSGSTSSTDIASNPIYTNIPGNYSGCAGCAGKKTTSNSIGGLGGSGGFDKCYRYCDE